MSSQVIRILIIGPFPPPVGGAAVLFAQLIRELDAFDNVELKVIDSAPRTDNFYLRLLDTPKLVYEVMRCIRAVDIVSFHSSLRGAIYFAPAIRLLASIYKKKWIYRGFGGGHINWWNDASRITRALFRFGALGADTVLLESKKLVAFFSPLTTNPIQWYPNSRPAQQDVSSPSAIPRPVPRFCYIGHVKPTKGINILFEAVRLARQQLDVDVYGPLSEGINRTDFDNTSVHYCGPLLPNEVIPTLRKYDVFVFPTFYEGEGYPGVLLEAFNAQLAIVTTAWAGIPEMVDETCSLVVEPKSAEELSEALSLLAKEPTLLRYLQMGSGVKAKTFDSASWTSYFVSLARSLASDHSPPGSVPN